MTEQDISGPLNLIPYGFYALTSRNGDDRNVMVLNWFSQVSFKEQHVILGLQKISYTYGLVQKSGKFLLNIFHKDDIEVIKNFTKSREKNPEKFEAANYTDAPVTGLPILDEASAYLECEVINEMDTGSGHAVILGRVVGGDVRRDQMEKSDTLTLLDVGWSYSG